MDASIVTYLVIAHLVGDFILQNEAMQRKSSSSLVCTKHVVAYSLPFLPLWVAYLVPTWLIVAILVQHWCQDRWALHLRWMKWYRQTPPDRWPVGPLCVDQAWHIACIGIFSWVAKYIG